MSVRIQNLSEGTCAELHGFYFKICPGGFIVTAVLILPLDSGGTIEFKRKLRMSSAADWLTTAPRAYASRVFVHAT